MSKNTSIEKLPDPRNSNETFLPQMNLMLSSITWNMERDRKMGERAIHARLQSIGVGVSRYGLVVVLLLIGLLKFTPPEAAGIQPLVTHSPLMSWMYAVLSVQAASDVIGFIEIATALLIASRPFFPEASFVGSVGAIVTFLLTISFLFSTPGALQLGHGISILGDTGQFLIKDLVLLGASCWIAAEALGAAGKQINQRV